MASGRQHDVIVYCTGFKPWELGADIVGRRGATLKEVWNGSPKAFLGLSTSGFPNLFFLMGPNTALGSGSIVYMIESQINYILNSLKQMKRRNLRVLDIRSEAQESFDKTLQEKISGSVWKSGCQSWYQDETGRNSAIWPNSSYRYHKLTRRIDLSNYVHE